METNDIPIKLHSEDYFGEQRDFWWNSDFLALMAQRWRLDQVQSMLDVGCGIGHWGRLWAPYLAQGASIVGIDREAKWVEKAATSPIARSATYQVAEATQLPFANDSFDFVTCQTVLMHLPEPQLALKEFLRVVKPGGLIAVSEPNNAAASLIRSSASQMKSVDERLQMVRFQMICEAGKKNLGEGDNSLGDLVTNYFSEEGLTQIKSYQSDKVAPLFPPYASKEQTVFIEHELDRIKKEMCLWDYRDTHRYFIAGGGSEEEFQFYWAEALKNGQDVERSIKDRTYHYGGGSMVYLVCGRRNLN